MTDAAEQRIDWILAEIAEIENQLNTPDLPTTEQEQLHDDWKYLQEELDYLTSPQQDPNEWVDNREDCSRCAGCAYCMEPPAYDGDEI